MEDDEKRLLIEITEEFPKHLFLLGRDMKVDEFVETLFDENVAKLISKLKAITTKNEGLEILWARFVENTTRALSDWYQLHLSDISDPSGVANWVLNELTVNSEVYANNKTAFKDLVLNQKSIIQKDTQ